MDHFTRELACFDYEATREDGSNGSTTSINVALVSGETRSI